LCGSKELVYFSHPGVVRGGIPNLPCIRDCNSFGQAVYCECITNSVIVSVLILVILEKVVVRDPTPSQDTPDC
jgi:hypothetical protein